MKNRAPRPRIMVVDDDEGMLVLMAESLRAEGYEVVAVDSAEHAKAALKKIVPDLLVLDLKLRDSDGPTLASWLQREQTPVPFLVVTGQGDEKVAVEVMKQGALDYVMKDTALLDLLPAVVRRAMATVAQEAALKKAQQEYHRLEREVLVISERERLEIGADLHDNLGQQLTALELMCTALKEEAADKPSLRKGLDTMGKMLRESIVQTRFLARGLVPVGTEPDALQNGLSELAARVNALGRVRCVFECVDKVEVTDSFIAGHLYRIVQEAVNNAIKHANATHVSIRLTRAADRITVEISDNGGGFRETAVKTKGMGLGLMQHRAQVIGAEWSIQSRKGQGVTIRCSLPSKDENPAG